MRKWMRDRLKRKKTTPANSEKNQAPLQPAYFDAAQAQASSSESSASEAVPPAPEPQPEAQSATPQEVNAPPPTPGRAAPSGNVDPQNRRRRRRGRGRRSPTPRAASPAPESTGATEPALAAAPAQSASASKGAVVLAIGLPGSGKSSWFKRHNITPLSSDMLRSLLFDDPTEQRFQDLIFSNLRSMLKARLIARRPLNYVDATNLTPHDRQSWIKLAKDFGYEVQAVYFDVPLEVCLERNQKRERVVNEEIMRRFAGKLKAPTFDEGFSKITVVRVKQKSSY
ncbi:MAG TPA: AAA family ATPase [Candidatus Binatia bacterium]|nr:AAA family ATPase [Candidatus Binatia bacterium]